MIILDSENSYGFANATIKVIDNTYETEVWSETSVTIPDFGVMIPVSLPTGLTNMMELYEPGDLAGYTSVHGAPNSMKYGYGPDMIYEILRRGASNVSVYTVNLRGPSATKANVVLLLKYKIEKDVPYVDDEGNQVYKDANGNLTTDPVPGGAIVRDVLHIKYETTSFEGVKKFSVLRKKMNELLKEPEGDEYGVIPYFAVVYRGSTSYGNNIYFSFKPMVAEYDGNMYFKVNLFNGTKIIGTDPICSFEIDPRSPYQSAYYIESIFNDKYPALRFVSAEPSEEVQALIEKYLYTVDEVAAGTADSPSVKYAAINPFSFEPLSENNPFIGIVVDEGSINVEQTNAFRLENGTDGDETRDELFRKFFAGEIIGDIASPMAYKINYIPDIGYDLDTKDAILELLTKRMRMTAATFMVGGEDGFESGLTEKSTHWTDTSPYLRLISGYQSPERFDTWTRRTRKFPAAYYDTIALMEHFGRNHGLFYYPFAGAQVRWNGYDDETMNYPSEVPQFIDALNKARINVVMKDYMPGGYMSDQLMNVERVSDQIEFNNALLIGNMLYDLVYLVHDNHFRFNEEAEVRAFNNKVEGGINGKYAPFSASMTCSVFREGTVGRAGKTNKIVVRIDLKDIARYANIELYLEDN